uniref:EXS domain-containing protein n=1 Tax=Amphimedon queenslandica TaxID=400682 RepID=A0A1X7SER7_AMPQE
LASSDRGSKFFKENVEKLYFHKSKEINALIQKTEDIMINQLENGNRGRAMAKLRVPPLGGVSSPWAILASGWLMGAIFIMAVVAIIACVYRNHSPLPWSPDTGVLLGLRSGFVLSVWFFSFATNTYFWRYFGVNNVLIFGFDPRNHLNFQQLFA